MTTGTGALLRVSSRGITSNQGSQRRQKSMRAVGIAIFPSSGWVFGEPERLTHIVAA